MRSEGRPITAMVIALTIFGGSFGFERRSTPTSPPEIVNSFVGVWASVSGPPWTELPSPKSCTGLEWHVTDQEGNTITGDFKATCAGGVALTRTATGTIEGPSIAWSASGTATSPVTPPCAFSLTEPHSSKDPRSFELTTPARPAWARLAAPRSFRSNNLAHPGVPLGDATAFSLAGKRNSS